MMRFGTDAVLDNLRAPLGALRSSTAEQGLALPTVVVAAG
jgi:hypothetical protein